MRKHILTVFFYIVACVYQLIRTFCAFIRVMHGGLPVVDCHSHG